MLEHIVTNPNVLPPLHTFNMKAAPNAEYLISWTNTAYIPFHKREP